MIDQQTDKNLNAGIRSTAAFKDLIILAVVTVTILILSYFFDVFIFLVRIFQENPHAITYIDEIITGLLSLSIGFAVFSWRRWKELQKESVRCIQLQEELIKAAETKADTERIISKQLHSEIELRKQKERYKQF